MIRLISIFILAFVVYVVLKTVLGLTFLYRKKEKASRRIKERQGGEMVEDPICHTYIPKSTAIKKMISGEPYYFCGKTCADAYPEK